MSDKKKPTHLEEMGKQAQAPDSTDFTKVQSDLAFKEALVSVTAKKTYPPIAELPIIEPSNEDRVLGEGFDANVRNFSVVLREDHPILTELKSIVDELSEVAGYPGLIQNIRVYEDEDNVPNASIVKTTRTVYISSSLIHSLNYEHDKILGVLAHELAHLFFSNKEHLEIASAATEFLLNHIDSYEEEYCVDRLSVYLMTRLGVDPQCVIDAHEILDSEQGKALKAAETIVFSSLLSTHPMTTRRLQQLKRLRRAFYSSTLRYDPKHTLSPAKHSDFHRKRVEWEIPTRWMNFHLSGNDYINPKDIVYDDPTLSSGIFASNVNVEGLTSNLKDEWWRAAMLSAFDEVEQDDIREQLQALSPQDLLELMNLDPKRCLSRGKGVSKVPGMVYGVMAILVEVYLSKEPDFDPLLDLAENFYRNNGVFFPYIAHDAARELLKAKDRQWFEEKLSRYGFIAEEFFGTMYLNKDWQLSYTGGKIASPRSTAPRPLYSSNFSVRIQEGKKSFLGKIVLVSNGDSIQIEKNKHEYFVVRIPAQLLIGKPKDEVEEILKEQGIEFDVVDLHDYWIKTIHDTIHALSNESEASAFFDEQMKRRAFNVAARATLGDHEISDLNFWEDPRMMVGALGEETALAYFSGTKRRAVPYTESLSSVGFAVEDLFWEFSSHYKDWLTKTGTEAIDYLVGCYSSQCLERDLWLMRSVGWPTIHYTHEIETVVTKIQALEDPNLLTRFARHFKNPIFILAASSRLWELKDQCIIPFDETYLNEVLAEVPPHLRANRALKELISCFPYPCAERDEKLRTLIDQAQTEEDTLALSKLYQTPALLSTEKRKRQTVVRTETLMDTIEKVDSLDREEILLYLLGKRRFLFKATNLYLEENIYEFKKVTPYRIQALYGNLKEQSLKFAKGYELDDFLLSKPSLGVMIELSLGINLEEAMRAGVSFSKQDRINLLTELLIAPKGAMNGKRKEKFVQEVVRLLVDRKEGVTNQLDENGRQACKSLLNVFLLTCPQEKLPAIFHDIWTLMTSDNIHSVPEALASIMQAYGGIMIKAGQYIATQVRDLPEEWRHAFRKLSDQNQHADKVLVYELSNQAFGGRSPLKEIGRKIAEGSMAAVYEAELHSGERVAYKKIHSWLDLELEEDAQVLASLVEHFNTATHSGKRLFPISLPTNLATIVKQQIKEELSMGNERNNYESLNAGLHIERIEGIRTPLVKRGLLDSADQPVTQSEDALILELIKGCSIDDDGAIGKLGLDPKALKKEVALANLRLILSGKSYHADLNPGNMIIQRKSGPTSASIVWIDPGNLGQLSTEAVTNLRNLFKKLINPLASKPMALGLFLASIIEQSAHPDLKDKINVWLQRHGSEKVSLASLNQNVTEFFDFCRSEQIELKEEWVHCFRALGLMAPFLQELELKDLMKLAPLLV
ncbi:MAG: AarF/UbiB family protein [Candidatus Gracilibacteria bacterium]|jgi:predicted unusual protein kinase regulating ubiquinone biosynthesis (AarF/ABC1/UbiB family)